MFAPLLESLHCLSIKDFTLSYHHTRSYRGFCHTTKVLISLTICRLLPAPPKMHARSSTHTDRYGASWNPLKLCVALPSSLASFPVVVPDTLHSALIACRQNGFREVHGVTDWSGLDCHYRGHSICICMQHFAQWGRRKAVTVITRLTTGIWLMGSQSRS